MKNIASRIFLVTSLLIVAGVLTFGYFLFRPELTVTTKDEVVQIHTLTLGEYYTPILALQIEEPGEGLVVEFTANSEKSMMHTVSITSGKNEFSDMYLNGYIIKGRQYEFKNDTVYQVTATWNSRSATS